MAQHAPRFLQIVNDARSRVKGLSVNTDPNNLMPEPPKALRDAAELVYLSGQDALSPEAQNDLLARLNTAPPARVIRDVRAVLRSDASNSTKILAIRDVVEAAGLVPAAGAEVAEPRHGLLDRLRDPVDPGDDDVRHPAGQEARVPSGDARRTQATPRTPVLT